MTDIRRESQRQIRFDSRQIDVPARNADGKGVAERQAPPLPMMAMATASFGVAGEFMKRS
ncbi:MAG TPA: hypothetical protein GX399_17310 [Xanthomonadaceae bacterium]|nr:hypothetical protein [Xanthomonadaceae bacterium]